MRRGQLRVLNPCTEDYDAMRGAGPTRFCDKCEKHVHNLSAMTRHEAEALLAEADGAPICVRYCVKPDGHIAFKRPRMGFIAVLSLAMAACTGYVDGEDLASPDDIEVCYDAEGYAVACDDVAIPYADTIDPGSDSGTAGTDPDPDPDPGVEPIARAPDPVPLPDPPEAVEIPQEQWLQGDVDPGYTGEGCPVPQPGTGTDDDYGEIMGEIEVGGIVPRGSRYRRVERRDRRADRREARRERRRDRREARR